MSGMDFTIGVQLPPVSKSTVPVDFLLLSDKFDTLSSDRRLRFLILPLVFGGGSNSGTSFSGLPGPGYEIVGSGRPNRRDGNGNDGALSPLDCC